MGGVISGAELAQRLVGSGKDITPVRLQKLARHLTSLQHLEEVLANLDEADAARVREETQPFIRKLS